MEPPNRMHFGTWGDPTHRTPHGIREDTVEEVVEPEGAVGAAFRPHMVSFQALCDTHW